MLQAKMMKPDITMKLLQHRLLMRLVLGRQNVNKKALTSLVFGGSSTESLLCASRAFSCLNAKPANSSFLTPSSCKLSTKAPGDQGHLVYVGQQADLFKGLKIFSLSTSGIGLLLQPYLLLEAQDLSLAWAIPLFSIVNTFIFVNPILIHYLAKRYALEIYFNPDTKVFTLYRLSFFARKKAMSKHMMGFDKPLDLTYNINNNRKEDNEENTK